MSHAALQLDALEDLRLAIAGHLTKIESLVASSCKLTLLIRNAAAPDGGSDILLTVDELPKAIEALTRLAKREAVIEAGSVTRKRKRASR